MLSILLKILPDIITTTTVSYVVKRLIERKPTQIADPSIQHSVMVTKRALYQAEKKALKTSEPADLVVKASTLSTVNRIEDPEAFTRYCVLLAYTYGKYGDEALLKILLERGCIDEEDVKELLRE